MGILKSSGWFVTSLLLIILAGGSLFVAFLAERINEKGIGSGVTMFIVTGIAVRLPESIILKTRDLINHFSTGFMWKYIAVMVGILAFKFAIFNCGLLYMGATCFMFIHQRTRLMINCIIFQLKY